MASHLRPHCLLNRLFRRKSKRTQSSASLAFVRGLHRWPVVSLMDSPYRGLVSRKMFPFDDIVLLCVFTLGTETFSGYVRHRNEQCHLSHDRELIFVASVKNVPKCLTLSTLGTHLVVFMSVIVHASHWYQAHNIMREIRSKAKANLPPNTKLIPDGAKTNSVGSSISKLYEFFSNISVVFAQVCLGENC